MHFYEKQKFRLDDSLYKYFPDTLKKHLANESTIRFITFRELLIHASGLPAGQNIFRMIRFDEENPPFDNYYCDEKSDRFCLTLGDSFYVFKDIHDTLWMDLHRIWLDPTKSYRYSDANMNLLYTMLRPFTGEQAWDRYLDSVFYKPMGMKNTLFIPIEKGIKKEKIAPTENDRYWRKQLIQGYVHDPTAAIYGGVAGNAGLFSNALDMGIFCQMLLNKGTYGGIKFFDEKTVELFTSTQNGTHRGLGFNKQISGSTYGCSHSASASTYGHTGFTGTAFWVDPEINFIYVFITNRVHPDPENKRIIDLGITRRVHDVVYKILRPESAI
jgi:CubicO group peptidase (beta-lactamase class C family)